MSKKQDLSAMFSEIGNDEILQPYHIESKQVDLLTTEPVRSPKSARKGPLDEVVMVGVRMTKRERKALKSLAGELDISVQEVIAQGVELVRQANAFR
jgi:hypothetical protein